MLEVAGGIERVVWEGLSRQLEGSGGSRMGRAPAAVEQSSKYRRASDELIPVEGVWIGLLVLGIVFEPHPRESDVRFDGRQQRGPRFWTSLVGCYIVFCSELE